MNNVNARIQNQMERKLMEQLQAGGMQGAGLAAEKPRFAGYGSAPCENLDVYATQPAPPSKEIPSRVEQLYGATDELSRLIARLEQRLAPVVEQIPVCEAEKACVPYATELGLQLSGILGRVELMTNAVLSIESRLQI